MYTGISYGIRIIDLQGTFLLFPLHCLVAKS